MQAFIHEFFFLVCCYSFLPSSIEVDLSDKTLETDRRTYRTEGKPEISPDKPRKSLEKPSHMTTQHPSNTPSSALIQPKTSSNKKPIRVRIAAHAYRCPTLSTLSSPLDVSLPSPPQIAPVSSCLCTFFRSKLRLPRFQVCSDEDGVSEKTKE